MPEPSRSLRRARRARPLAVALTLLLGGLVACSGERPSFVDDGSSTTSTTEEETTSTTEPETSAAEVAEAKASSIGVFASEDAADADRELEAGVDTSVDTIPIVFLVKARDEDDERVEVYLPAAPVGSTGWVDVDDVTIRAAPYRIEVDLTAHRIRVLRDEEVVLEEPIGVGDADLPPPGTEYYLKELVAPPDPDGEYGTYVYGLSGFASLLDSIIEGEGVVGIHGTDEPDTVGTDVSSGSIRLSNDAIVRMVEDIGLPLGTPVEIQS